MRKMVAKPRRADALTAEGRCLCGEVRLEIDVPVRWAWHDHSAASRRAHGAAYATYVGCWKSRVRLIAGEGSITRFESPGNTRSFCSRCGAPLLYERSHAPRMVNIPRAIFDQRTGREPRYHLSLREAPEWTYLGEALAALMGFPGVMWERPRRKKPRAEFRQP
jgi:hypothetical protein